jgi:hypothetical protein
MSDFLIRNETVECRARDDDRQRAFLPIVRIECAGAPGLFHVSRKRRLLPGWWRAGSPVPATAVLAVLKMVCPDYKTAYRVYDAFLDEIGNSGPIDEEGRQEFDG